MDDEPLTDEQAEAMLARLRKHCRQPVMPIRRYGDSHCAISAARWVSAKALLQLHPPLPRGDALGRAGAARTSG